MYDGNVPFVVKSLLSDLQDSRYTAYPGEALSIWRHRLHIANTIPVSASFRCLSMSRAFVLGNTLVIKMRNTSRSLPDHLARVAGDKRFPSLGKSNRT